MCFYRVDPRPDFNELSRKLDLGVFTRIWMYLGVFGRIWMHLDVFGRIWTYLDVFGLI